MAAATYYNQVQEIYVAYYGRPADPAGLQYWAGKLDAVGGNLTTIINAFGNSTESTALYAGSSNSAIVTAIYQQLFNRAPDSAGLAFYTAELTAGRMTGASIALNVADGAVSTDATYLANKITVANAFTDALTVDSSAALAYDGTTAITAARSLITGVTTSAATTNVASTITSIKSGGGSTAGQTFTLTTGDDLFTLTAGNDSVSGGTATLSEDDRVSDSSSTDSDVLTLTLSDDAPDMDVRGVEAINITYSGFTGFDSDLDNVNGATVTAVYSGTGFNGNATFTNVGTNAIVASTGFDGTVSVQGSEDAAVTANLARTVNVGTTTAADGQLAINAAVATTVAVGGGDEVTITAPNATAITITSAGMDVATLNVGKSVALSSTGVGSIINVASAATITVSADAATTFDEFNVTGGGAVTLDLADSTDADGNTFTGLTQFE